MRMCGSCEQERDQLKARIAELEAEVAQLKGQKQELAECDWPRPKYPKGTRVIMLPCAKGYVMVGPGVVVSLDWCEYYEYGVKLDSHPDDVAWAPEDELIPQSTTPKFSVGDRVAVRPFSSISGWSGYATVVYYTHGNVLPYRVKFDDKDGTEGSHVYVAEKDLRQA